MTEEKRGQWRRGDERGEVGRGGKREPTRSNTFLSLPAYNCEDF